LVDGRLRIEESEEAMNGVMAVFDLVLALLRPTLAALAGALALVLAIDWLARTRRLNPFGPIPRFFRSVVDPLLLPIERRVVRHGGLPSSAPWWALGIVVVGGIVLIEVLTYVRGMAGELAGATAVGAIGIARVLIGWTFLLLEIALIVRVIASWINLSRYSGWVRWSFGLTEWMLRPLRRIIPPVAMFDLSPLIAWVLLSYILEPFVLSLLTRVG
jgi:YggT family protein